MFVKPILSASPRRGVAEAIEAVAHGDESTSRVVGRSIDEDQAAARYDHRRRCAGQRRNDRE